MGDARRVVIIGAGVAGLCTGVYARRCGYEVQILEQSHSAGGLATSWQRGGYTFETCLHWLLGTRPGDPFHEMWCEVFDVDRLHFVFAGEYERLTDESGRQLSIFTDPGRMEAELLAKAPEDAEAIRELASAVRQFMRIALPMPGEAWLGMLRALLANLPELAALRKYSKISIAQLGERFQNRLLRSFFQSGDSARLSSVGLLFALAWMARRNAGYPAGGSRAVTGAIVDRLQNLGARLRFGTRVTRIVTGNDAATGVETDDGGTVKADWVISAADAHATLFGMLDSKYLDPETKSQFDRLEPFPSYAQVSLGVARDLSDQPGYHLCVLDNPVEIDPGTWVLQLAFRIFHFDPGFAPEGKTAVTCFIPTRNHAYWTQLRGQDFAQYQYRKQHLAHLVISHFERLVPGSSDAVEVVDVATPATVIRYTGNWQGSMEGWLLTPGMGYSPLPNTLPGLRNFVMAGQWVMPGGGLPSCVITARRAVQAMCRQDHVPFVAGAADVRSIQAA